MDLSQELQEAKSELFRVQSMVKGLEAKSFLYDLWQTASYTSTILSMHEIYKGKTEFELFGSLWMIDELADEGRLVKYVREQAKYFKDMDDSGDWPEWKDRAYKAAKDYQEWKS